MNSESNPPPQPQCNWNPVRAGTLKERLKLPEGCSHRDPFHSCQARLQPRRRNRWIKIGGHEEARRKRSKWRWKLPLLRRQRKLRCPLCFWLAVITWAAALIASSSPWSAPPSPSASLPFCTRAAELSVLCQSCKLRPNEGKYNEGTDGSKPYVQAALPCLMCQIHIISVTHDLHAHVVF